MALELDKQVARMDLLVIMFHRIPLGFTDSDLLIERRF